MTGVPLSAVACVVSSGGLVGGGSDDDDVDDMTGDEAVFVDRANGAGLGIARSTIQHSHKRWIAHGKRL